MNLEYEKKKKLIENKAFSLREYKSLRKLLVTYNIIELDRFIWDLYILFFLHSDAWPDNQQVESWEISSSCLSRRTGHRMITS